MDPSRTELGRHVAANQVIDPDPGQGAKRDFESAGPVGPAMKRVGRDPAFELRLNFVPMASVAGQQKRLGQDNQVLMTIQFPDQFVVARAGRVEVRYAAEVDRAGFNAARIIAAPADVLAGVDDGPKNWKLVAMELIGQIDDLLRRTGAGFGQWQTWGELAVERGFRRPRREHYVDQFLPGSE